MIKRYSSLFVQGNAFKSLIYRMVFPDNLSNKTNYFEEVSFNLFSNRLFCFSLHFNVFAFFFKIYKKSYFVLITERILRMYYLKNLNYDYSSILYLI